MEKSIQCRYCGSVSIVESSNGEFVCTECGTVLGPVLMPHRRVTRKEILLGWRFSYA
jgi:transcription initiation factor TFIIIB Brf1 subunit/transcription initiation factor TFIIB